MRSALWTGLGAQNDLLVRLEGWYAWWTVFSEGRLN